MPGYTFHIMLLFLLSACGVLLCFLLSALRKSKLLKSKVSELEARYAGIIDSDKAAREIIDKAKFHSSSLQAQAENALAHKEKQISAANGELDNLRKSYADKKQTYDRLVQEIAIFDDRLAFAEMGIYEPHFDFSDSESYKAEIEVVRSYQKRMVSEGRAVTCEIEWTVDGSVSKGKTMTNRAIKLTLRAFNGECDAAISNVRWNNVNAMEKRIIYAMEQLDELNASSRIFIAEPYCQLKLQELRLSHEYREKQKQEREDRAEASRAAREEQKLLRDMEDAERQEAKYQKLLEKARKEALSLDGNDREAYQQKITILEQELQEAHSKFERAQAMAERTKSGYVYIISNVGSFGPEMIKIGLTRRLDPADRVRELGDASVPFFFDTHAIIYSDEAPALERALHGEFASRRVNATNMRKEFFKVSLEEVESAVTRLAPQASFFRDVEAQEYRETLALRKAKLEKEAQASVGYFPDSI